MRAGVSRVLIRDRGSTAGDASGRGQDLRWGLRSGSRSSGSPTPSTEIERGSRKQGFWTYGADAGEGQPPLAGWTSPGPGRALLCRRREKRAYAARTREESAMRLRRPADGGARSSRSICQRPPLRSHVRDRSVSAKSLWIAEAARPPCRPRTLPLKACLATSAAKSLHFMGRLDSGRLAGESAGIAQW